MHDDLVIGEIVAVGELGRDVPGRVLGVVCDHGGGLAVQPAVGLDGVGRLGGGDDAGEGGLGVGGIACGPVGIGVFVEFRGRGAAEGGLISFGPGLIGLAGGRVGKR